VEKAAYPAPFVAVYTANEVKGAFSTQHSAFSRRVILDQQSKSSS
jgi:hypothetical protein